MIVVRWIRGIFAQRLGRLLGAMAGVATTITLLASLGIFLTASSATMTERAAAGVGVDWQVRLAAPSDLPAVRKLLGTMRAVQGVQTVRYTGVAGFQATTGATSQTTGKGKVVGINAGYLRAFPSVVRKLTGAAGGVEIAQQTAANLHIKEGDTLSILRAGAPPVQVRVSGVVAIHNADAFFQGIGGVSIAAAPIAPPDNVLLVPSGEWHRLFAGSSSRAAVETELHVRLDRRRLPVEPTAAYTYVVGLAHNLEARAAGMARVGDNLASQLLAVRADSLYARVLFLFLGLPGVILSILLTLSIALSGRKHLIQEQALLKMRGATSARILGFEAIEAVIVGLGGIVLGILLISAVAKPIMGIRGVSGGMDLLWIAGSAALGCALAVSAVVLLVWRELKEATVSSSRRQIRVGRMPLWRRSYVDVVLLLLSLLVYGSTVQSGYQVVMAPEGVPQISVHYSAFIAPLCLWIGGVLFALRLLEGGIARGQRAFGRLLSPIARNLSVVVAASINRQRSLISRGVTLVALAVAFAVSTSIFNTTYNAQSRVDAQLTNGADVTVTGLPSAPPDRLLAQIRSVPGVAAAEPMMHRFAYVGNDLQDLYGIDASLIGRATKMSNAYFAGGNAKATLALLAKRPDGVLVSEETRMNYQLAVGDNLNLRLQFADHQYHEVPFTFIGVTREFPTAPKDSFLVANASYLAGKTGLGAREVVLVRADGKPGRIASEVKRLAASLPGARVTDIDSVAKAIGSGLTQIDLRGLTRLELLFAVLFVMGATGLILALGLGERRRNFAILDALGATSRQLGGFIWSEGLVILIGGGIIGALLGVAVAGILTTVLKGVFDPPPDHLLVPWLYMLALVAAAAGATVAAVFTMKRISHRPVVEELRRL